MMLLSFRSFCFLRLTLGISGLRQMGITAHVKFPRSPSLARIRLSITCGAKRRQVHPVVGGQATTHSVGRLSRTEDRRSAPRSDLETMRALRGQHRVLLRVR